jgi:hypothetical protein
MSERYPNALQTAAGIVAAGALLAACGGTSPQEAEQSAGHSEAYRCSAHMYALGEIAVDVSKLDFPFKDVTADKIRVQLPSAKSVTRRVAPANRAEFDIPSNYHQLFVQAAVGKQWVACTTIYRPKTFDQK